MLLRLRLPLLMVLGHFIASPVIAQAQVPPSETLLPASTQFWVSAPDLQESDKKWNETNLGKLMDDPIMKPFRDDLNKQLRERREEEGSISLGISWEDARTIAGGEACMALVHPPKRQPSRIVLVDVTGKAEPAGALMKRQRDDVIKQGAKHSAEKVGDATLNIYTKGEKVRLVDVRHENFFCAGTDKEVVTYILKRYLKLSAEKDDLANFAPYIQVQLRLAADNKLLKVDAKAKPHLRWFTQPIGYGRAQQALNPERDPDKLNMLDVATKSGFEAMQGVGGFVQFSEGPYDILHRTAAFAPKPWTKSMHMLSLVNDNGLLATDDAWIPADLATHSTLYLELLKAFDNFGPFFDEAVAGGKKNAWDRSVKAWKLDEYGPKVDVRDEIIKRLVVRKEGRDVARCTWITDNRHPVTPTSERQLTAVKIRPTPDDYAALGMGADGRTCTAETATPAQHKAAHEAAEREVRDAVNRFYKPDERVKLAILHKGMAPGIDVWELLPEEDEEDDTPAKKKKKKAPAVEVDVKGAKGAKVPAPAEPLVEPESVCVTQGYLLYATHLSLMRKVVKHIAGGGLPLAADADYGAVMDRLDGELKLRNWPNSAARRFSRTDEEYLVNYELARTGELKQSESLIAGILTGISNPGGKPLDYTKLPKYGAARVYLKPNGLLVRSETEVEAKDAKTWCGWFVVGFVLKK
jgi:hypothetical protein